ncbi:MAG: energy transducer TonB [Pseudomonadota bacterium]
MRYIIAIAVSAAVTFGLLFLMQFLISVSKAGLNEGRTVHFVDFVRVKRDETVDTKKPKPKKPPKVDQPPPDMPQPQLDNVNPDANAVSVSPVGVEANMDIGIGGFGGGDGEYLPIVKVAPVYPNRALSRGLEGYVIVEFTVTKLGTTKNISVVESSSSIFEKSAMKAAAKFKYKPRVVDGEPIDVAGVRNKLTFELED